MKTSRNTKHEHVNHNQINKRAFQKYMQEKLAITVIVIMLALFALVLVLYNLVDEKNEEYTKIVLSQHSSYDSRIIPYKRGDIVDRNGTYLAVSEKVYNLIIDPVQIYSSEKNYLIPTIDALVQCFGYDRAELTAAIQEKAGSRYLRYERRLSADQKEAFEALKKEVNQAYREAGESLRVNGVWFEDEYRRMYPYTTLACHVIGFSRSEGSEGTGGIEQYYNSSLIGVNGREYGYLNDDSNKETVIKPASNGNTVVSTIDVNIQNIVEKGIDRFQEEMGSRQIGVIAMDPGNGEILAMATNKRFDLNNPRDLSAYYTEAEIEAMDEQTMSDAWNQMWRNFCISDTFEPGSPAKIFTVATGLEDAVFQTSTHFFCDGFQQVVSGDKPIKCTAYSKGGHGNLTVEETLMVSCNDAMMQMAAMEGRERFKKYQDMFNFGAKTGLDLPGEADARTLVYSADKMGPADLATNSFGQNYNCTMVQMAAAFASVINGGSYYEPHVVKQILNEQGAVVEKIEPNLVRETVSETTSRFINEALLRTVAEGTGKAAQVEGYHVGGKTGTAEKHPRGQGKYLVSFCGFAPAEDPQILLYVVIDEPNVEDQAHSSFASAVFSQLMGEILPYMNIFPITDTPQTSEEVQSQLPEAEGITEHTGSPADETDESGEPVTEPAQRVYETDEYVPVGEDGQEGLDIPAGSLRAEPELESTTGETTEPGESQPSSEAETAETTAAS